MPNPRWSRLCHKRSAWRSMHEPLESMLTGSQAETGLILLACHANRHPILRKGVWQVSTLQQRHATTFRGTYTNERPLAVCPMGVGHRRTFAHYNTAAQIPHHGDRLLYQMGQGKTIGHYHRKECTKLHLEKHHLPLQNPHGLCLWQWKAIRQWHILRFLPATRNQ